MPLAMASKVLHFSLGKSKSYSSQDTTSLLFKDISKLKFVLRVLRFHKFPEARWFDFGLNLGLLHPTLEAIESAHRGDLSRCLTECLTKWLTEADDNVTTVGPITWQTLANALREMELKSIADNIHKISKLPKFSHRVLATLQFALCSYTCVTHRGICSVCL